MSRQDTSGPAFPTTIYDEDGEVIRLRGMSLRDWFAGQALVGLLAQGAGADPISIDMMPRDCTAHAAYALADAMLAERDKP